LIAVTPCVRGNVPVPSVECVAGVIDGDDPTVASE
jgi:hypothetical protein